ncbi:HU family DNA-binding protein [Sulfurospirillum multivorans]|uniref:DNA-binding protein HU, epsilon-proteobacterial type n=2 Tax=Sulfurospirillum multivorans TaxID=66821 RepID=A0AA86AP66_SULMK|nr:HU family DNA-binding protein [Sulfurospirillum multivorans]AHJ13033.1 DNA-binding protein HU, epsilon-proteobacterial type [Sulfurospirillum multivorans DSM 12446]QEH06524.1 DNA-binding protein HU, epsilon-proteobacterial type [Sulfurospirillum multivorans]
MNKSEFIQTVAEKSGLTKKATGEAVDAILEVIEASLVAGQDVNFIGFGSFRVANKAARIARVPGTDNTIDVPATKAVKFKVGKALKDSVASAK